MNVLLRDVCEDDLPIFFEHQCDPVAYELAGFTPRDDQEFRAQWHGNILEDDHVVKKTILIDGEVVGFVVSFERSGKREIGYWIGRAHWGRGIASEAIRRFLSHDPKRPLFGVVAKHNLASIRVLEKCGFTIVEPRVGIPRDGAPVEQDVLLRLDADARAGRRDVNGGLPDR